MRPAEKVVAVIDTETTGLDPSRASIVEFALVVPDKTLFHSLVKPSHPIEIEAMAAHHLRDKDVENAPSLTKVLAQASSLLKKMDLQPEYYAAHNAGFDSGFLPGLTANWICTWKCAQHLWPEAPGYSNQCLRYWLPGVDDEVRGHSSSSLPPHRALPDAYVTSRIIKRMLELKSPDELVELTKIPVLQKICRFGKYYGLPWSQVPVSYLEFIASKGPERTSPSGQKEGFSDDIRHTVLHYLRQSRLARAI
jgi:exodeoxyribonuclease X